MDKKWILVILLWAILLGVMITLFVKECTKSAEQKGKEAEALRKIREENARKWEENRRKDKEKQLSNNSSMGCAGGIFTMFLCLLTFIVIVFTIIVFVGIGS